MLIPLATRPAHPRYWRFTPAVVIWSPNLGVFAVNAAVFCVLFAAWWTHYLHSVSAADSKQISLSLILFELSTYSVNAVQLHVHAADVLVRAA